MSLEERPRDHYTSNPRLASFGVIEAPEDDEPQDELLVFSARPVGSVSSARTAGRVPP